MSGEHFMKRCTVCLTDQDLSNFRRYSGRSRDGFRPLCKTCQRAYEAVWRSTRTTQRAQARATRADKEAAYRKDYDAKNRGAMLAKEAARRAARKGIPCDLLSHIAEIESRVQNQVCELSGVRLNFHCSTPSWDSPSLHRTVPHLGYVYTNMMVVCFGMNATIGSWGEDAARNFVSAWLERS